MSAATRAESKRAAKDRAHWAAVARARAEAPKDPVRTFNQANVSTFKWDAARHVLRGLKVAGLRIIGEGRSQHGSDCGDTCSHARAPMGRCRCMRVFRLRVDGSGDWLLLFGDAAEGFKVQLQGPYHHDTPLAYGGGFWCRVAL